MLSVLGFPPPPPLLSALFSLTNSKIKSHNRFPLKKSLYFSFRKILRGLEISPLKNLEACVDFTLVNLISCTIILSSRFYIWFNSTFVLFCLVDQFSWFYSIFLLNFYSLLDQLYVICFSYGQEKQKTATIRLVFSNHRLSPQS